jgi:DnaJ-class molecular chaperone
MEPSNLKNACSKCKGQGYIVKEGMKVECTVCKGSGIETDNSIFLTE